jgi:hypothetical protein
VLSGLVPVLLADGDVRVQNKKSLVKRLEAVFSGSVGNDIARRPSGLLLYFGLGASVVSPKQLMHVFDKSLIVGAFTYDQ